MLVQRTEKKKPRIDWDVSELRRKIMVAGLALLTAALATLASSFDPVDLATYLIIAVVAFFALKYFEFSLGIFIAACTMNLFEFAVGPYAIRVETLGLLISVASLLIHALVKRRKIVLNKETILVMLYIMFTLFVSYFLFNHTWVWSKPGILQLTLSSLGTMFIIAQVGSMKEVRAFTDVLVVVGLFQALYGFLGYIFYNPDNVLFSTPIMTGQLSTSLTLRGLFFEANLFSVLMGFCFILCLTHMAQKTKYKSKLYNPITALIFAAAILLGWTRAVWLSLAICLFIVIPLIVLFQKKVVIHPRFIFKLVFMVCLLVPVGFIVIQSFNANGVDFMSKITNFASTENGSGSFRAMIFDITMSRWEQSPFFGRGYFSLKETSPTAWIVSSPLAVLHDTGIIGMIIALGLLIPLIVTGFKLSITAKGENRPYIISIYCGSLMAIIATCFTTAHTLSFFWLQLGLLAAAIKYMKDRSEALER
ncbi:hypothetical protein [Paenibacillus sp. 453mf]|uniref:O-antigen ligase family protein n=1 Tax=Paenibacillus sp. 453mf TaxID=1761874 RepID=UPI0008ED4C98|nr:hypothetical protein [Paenibacillus sp. 453mf]SFS61013.1 hypothetical protein SAMN04488601_1012544 [Paenibacillus sp. 453mf]